MSLDAHLDFEDNGITKLNLSDQIANRLRDMIIQNELAPGDRIREREICKVLDVSRTPLREALHKLATEGLIELIPNRGGQIVRAAGTSAKILAKEGNYVTLRLPSKEIRLIRKECFATIGEISNNDAFLVQSGKAGRTRWLGKRPTVRGSVMNPCDHPHGGGEGRAPIGRTRPLTPWGKPALGIKTRKRKKNHANCIFKGKGGGYIGAFPTFPSMGGASSVV